MPGPENDHGDEDVVAEADAGSTELMGDPLAKRQGATIRASGAAARSKRTWPA